MGVWPIREAREVLLLQVPADQFVVVAGVQSAIGQGNLGTARGILEDPNARLFPESILGCFNEGQVAVLAEGDQVAIGKYYRSAPEVFLSPADLAGLQLDATQLGSAAFLAAVDTV